MREIIFATGNENKMREIREIFEGLPFVIHSLKEAGLVSDPEENGATFAENAFIKAEAVHALRPDAIVMSDDSGLSVDYLNGEPGVFSARWLGRDTSYTEKNAELIRRAERPLYRCDCLHPPRRHPASHRSAYGRADCEGTCGRKRLRL